MTIFATLGKLEMSVLNAPTVMEIRRASVYAEHPLMGGKPLLQRTGEALDEIPLTVEFHIGWCDPAAQYAQLDKLRSDHQPLAFVFGTGDYLGTFVATDVGAALRQTDGTGALLSIECTVTLKESIGDPVKPNPPGVVSHSAALAPATPVPVNAIIPIEAMPQPVIPPVAQPENLLDKIGQALKVADNIAGAVSKVNDIAAVAANGDMLAAVGLAGSYAPQLSEMAGLLPVEAFQDIATYAPLAADAGSIVTGLAGGRDLLSQASTLLHGASTLSGISSAAQTLQAAQQTAEKMQPAVDRLEARATLGSRIAGIL